MSGPQPKGRGAFVPSGSGGLATDLSAGDGGAADGGECGGAVGIRVPSLRTLSAH